MLSKILDWLTLIWLNHPSYFQSVKILDGNDPGSCDESNHGAEVLIKDREDNERLLICADNNDGFVWKATDGI